MQGQRRESLVGRAWSEIKRFVFQQILHANDPPHRLALGFAIGMFVTFTPTVGAQMALVFFLSWLLRANKAVGLPLVWISNPATLVPIYYSCYWLGRVMLGTDEIGLQWWDELRFPPDGWWPSVKFYWEHLIQIAAPLWVGGLVVGFGVAIPSYYAIYGLVYAYRMRRWGQVVPPSAADTPPAAETGEAPRETAAPPAATAAELPAADGRVADGRVGDAPREADGGESRAAASEDAPAGAGASPAADARPTATAEPAKPPKPALPGSSEGAN